MTFVWSSGPQVQSMSVFLNTVLLAQSPVLSTAFTHLFITYLYINQNYPLLTFVLQIFFEDILNLNLF